MKHGYSLRGKIHPLYFVFDSMKKRCYKETDPAYSRYGLRGIYICDSWLNDIANFIEWSYDNGYQKGLTIDRIDNDGPYSPDNCRWMTYKVNNNNRNNNKIIAAFNEVKTLSEWVDDSRCSASYGTLQARLRYGWNAEIAIAKPVRLLSKKKKEGF